MLSLQKQGSFFPRQVLIHAGHSFRIGAATTTASVGLPPWLIKTLGRWSSDCYERYVRCPQALIFEVPQKLVRDAYH